MKKLLFLLVLFFSLYSISQVKKNDKAIIVEDYSEENLNRLVGKKITLIGKSENEKIGATLKLSNKKRIYIENFHSWPNNYSFGNEKSKTVKVTGILIERNDLPVFISDDNYDGKSIIQQGIPVPKRTDLKKISHRFLLKDVTWKILK